MRQARSARIFRIARLALLRIWLPAALIALWWFGTEHSTTTFFPPLSAILTSFRRLWLFGDTRSQLVPSLEHMAVGLAIAIVVGVASGLLLWRLPRVGEAFAPLISFFRALPAPALVPGFIALLGVGARMEAVAIAFGCVWPVLLNTLDGLAGADRLPADTAQAYRLSPARKVFYVYLPGASPQIFAGLRTALQAAIILMVVSEELGATFGIGYFIINAQQLYQFPEMWSGIIVLGIVGALLNLVLVAIERIVLRWYYGYRSMEGAV
jgi:sulfonate transport system permease protein